MKYVKSRDRRARSTAREPGAARSAGQRCSFEFISLSFSSKQIHDLYRLTEPWIGPRQAEPDLKPRFNIAPTQTAPVVRLAENGGCELALLRWGLVPSWAKDAKIGYRTINARAETVATAPTFRAAFNMDAPFARARGCPTMVASAPRATPAMGVMGYSPGTRPRR